MSETTAQNESAIESAPVGVLRLPMIEMDRTWLARTDGDGLPYAQREVIEAANVFGLEKAVVVTDGDSAGVFDLYYGLNPFNDNSNAFRLYFDGCAYDGVLLKSYSAENVASHLAIWKAGRHTLPKYHAEDHDHDYFSSISFEEIGSQEAPKIARQFGMQEVQVVADNGEWMGFAFMGKNPFPQKHFNRFALYYDGHGFDFSDNVTYPRDEIERFAASQKKSESAPGETPTTETATSDAGQSEVVAESGIKAVPVKDWGDLSRVGLAAPVPLATVHPWPGDEGSEPAQPSEYEKLVRQGLIDTKHVLCNSHDEEFFKSEIGRALVPPSPSTSEVEKLASRLGLHLVRVETPARSGPVQVLGYKWIGPNPLGSGSTVSGFSLYADGHGFDYVTRRVIAGHEIETAMNLKAARETPATVPIIDEAGAHVGEIPTASSGESGSGVPVQLPGVSSSPFDHYLNLLRDGVGHEHDRAVNTLSLLYNKAEKRFWRHAQLSGEMVQNAPVFLVQKRRGIGPITAIEGYFLDDRGDLLKETGTGTGCEPVSALEIWEKGWQLFYYETVRVFDDPVSARKWAQDQTHNLGGTENKAWRIECVSAGGALPDMLSGRDILSLDDSKIRVEETQWPDWIKGMAPALLRQNLFEAVDIIGQKFPHELQEAKDAGAKEAAAQFLNSLALVPGITTGLENFTMENLSPGETMRLVKQLVEGEIHRLTSRLRAAERKTRSVEQMLIDGLPVLDSCDACDKPRFSEGPRELAGVIRTYIEDRASEMIGDANRLGFHFIAFDASGCFHFSQSNPSFDASIETEWANELRDRTTHAMLRKQLEWSLPAYPDGLPVKNESGKTVSDVAAMEQRQAAWWEREAQHWHNVAHGYGTSELGALLGELRQGLLARGNLSDEKEAQLIKDIDVLLGAAPKVETAPLFNEGQSPWLNRMGNILRNLARYRGASPGHWVGSSQELIEAINNESEQLQFDIRFKSVAALLTDLNRYGPAFREIENILIERAPASSPGGSRLSVKDKALLDHLGAENSVSNADPDEDIFRD